MNLDTTDWKDFCQGKKIFDKSHFYTLLMKDDFYSDISEEDYSNVFKYFHNSEELIKRLKTYHNDIDYRVGIDNIEEHLLCSTKLDILEKSKIIIKKDKTLANILEKNIRYEDDIIKIEDNQESNCHENYIDIIEEYIAETKYYADIKVNALFEAFYGLTHNFQLVWYLGNPLLEVDINFDHYFNIWKVGGDYAITENGVIVSRYKDDTV